MIKALRLQNFRSYKDKSLNFSAGPNIIIGPNAVGKTNLLEAILFSRSGQSYRAKDDNLIAFNKPWARLDSLDGDSKRLFKLVKDQKPPKTININERVYKRLPSRLKLPVILFEPNHLGVINGSPETHRHYLDVYISQINPEYSIVLAKYQRVLAQRNSLLKSPQPPKSDQLFPWNIRLSQLAGQLVIKRQGAIWWINKLLPGVYTSLSKDQVRVSLKYLPQLPVAGYESSYLKKLETTLAEDLRSGFTSYGPHRDDFTFMYNNHPSYSYASRGELRSGILALKITELQAISKVQETKAIMLFDDVYSELDKYRQQALTDHLKDVQSFITSTSADMIASKPPASSLIRL